MRLWPFTRGTGPAAEPRRALESSRAWSMELDDRGIRFAGAGIDAPAELLGQMLGEVSNRRIARSDALKASAVLRARNLIAGVPATLPLGLYDKRTREEDTRNWLGVEPSPDIPASVQFSQTYEDLIFEGVSYWKVTRRLSPGVESRRGYPVEARHIDFRAVSRHQTLGMPSEVISADLQFSPHDPVFIDGHAQDLDDIIMFLSPHPPLLVHAAKHIRTVLLLDQTAASYATDPLPFGYFTDQDELGINEEDTLEDEEIKELLAVWDRARKEHRWGYVPRNLALKQLEWPTPQQMQLVQARNHATMEIARATGLDPEDMGVQIQGGSRTYVNAEQRRLDLVDFNLFTYIKAVEERLSMRDVVPRGLVARFDVPAFTRADFASRMSASKDAIEAGIYTPNERRKTEFLPDRPEPASGNGNENQPQRPPVGVGSNGNGNGSNGNG
jgi:phage portal protein BeeE